ncbi:MAG: hypothetical protein CTY25_15325 [Methylobacterium sp.]|nr:MAG: hypothetical protein CTY25_15325 [Methylobacterium sp.]
MGVVQLGPGLAGFPAFPNLPLAALANPEALPPEVIAQIQGTFAALGFTFTDTTFSFALDSSIFGVPGNFRYTFNFTGDFSSLAADPTQLLRAFDPAHAAEYLIRFESARTVDAINDRLAIAAEADTAGPPIPFALFFQTLLDPRNYTQDLLGTFTGNLEQFGTLDLSAFTNGVISARSNGPTISTDGTISRPDGSFVDSNWGVVSFNGEVLNLSFSEVHGSAAGDVLASDRAGASIHAGGGNDLVIADANGQSLFGDAGRDVLVGGSVSGVSLYGGAGADVLVAGRGGGFLDGGAGADVLYIGNATATGGNGADRFIVDDSTTHATILDFNWCEDTLDLGAVASSLRGVRFSLDASGDLVLGLTGGRSVTLDGLGLADIGRVRQALDFSGNDGNLGVEVASARGETLTGGRGNDTLVGRAGHDVLNGGNGDDQLVGGAGNDSLNGGAGRDILLGGTGNDRLLGGSNDDVLDGGNGNDILNGGSGFDVLSGGFGADRFVFDTLGQTYDRISDFELGLDRIDLSGLFCGTVTASNFAEHVRIDPLGSTELTGFLQVDLDGAAGPAGWTIVAQLDGSPFAILGGASSTTLTASDFILG